MSNQQFNGPLPAELTVLAGATGGAATTATVTLSNQGPVPVGDVQLVVAAVSSTPLARTLLGPGQSVTPAGIALPAGSYLIAISDANEALNAVVTTT
jgi:hypothetical protein